MKLHQLVLTNYRGIDHRAVDFPDHGVVVVSGPNEVGKSSMIEALDLLLESKDRSTKKDVKQTKPAHADVGTEITAEISTGPYRFTYHKRFHKIPETQLTVQSPHREQLTGDEAHERVTAIMAATVDTELWRAQRVLQAHATDAVDLSSCDALSNALDAAAGDAAAASDTGSVLLERITAEYRRYFTPTGRPTAEWAAAQTTLSDAAAKVDRCSAAVSEVDQRVALHAELTDHLADLDHQRQPTDARHREARTASERITALTEQLRQAESRNTAAAATSAAAAAAQTERVRLRDEVDRRTATVAALNHEVIEATEAATTAENTSRAAEARAQAAEQRLDKLRARIDSARITVELLAQQQEADRLAARIDRISAVENERDTATGALADITVTDSMVRAIEDAAAAVDRTKTQLAAISAAMEVTAATDVELVSDGQHVHLAEGESWSRTAPVAFDVPGMMTVRVSPGATAADVQDEHTAAQQNLDAALTAAGVDDVAAARSLDRQRREHETNRDRIAATLSGLCQDEPASQLRARLTQLRTKQGEGPAPVTQDDATARQELATAESAVTQATNECATQRQASNTAQTLAREAATRVAVLQDKSTNQQAELTAVTDRLTAQRSSVTDDELATTAQDRTSEARAAEETVTKLAAQLTDADPDAVNTELDIAAGAARELQNQCDEIGRRLHEIDIELSVFGAEGRYSQLSIAEWTHERAATEHASIGRRARAAQLLQATMLRNRNDSRLRYVEPFRTEIQRLGRPVFGPDFEVDIDSELRIATRTLGGRTVPYESLSGGAKEQLGVLVRLAAASLVAKEAAVPVLIDDALGFTDPDRLATMGAVFANVGTNGQVIVLTCSPDRYQSVAGAHRLALDAH